MLFTRASEYALIALIHLSDKEGPCDVETMSAQLNIPKSFLAKIMQGLARDGLLRSFKGAKGGFVLARKPHEILIKDVFYAAEKRALSVFECSGGDCYSQQIHACKIYPVISRLQEGIDNILSSLTLEQLIKEGDKACSN